MVTIEIEEGVRIPTTITDVESFRRWAASDDYPERGRFSFLRDRIWVDLTLEQLFSHNQAKEAFYRVVGGMVKGARLGYFFPDGMRLSHPEVGLSTEPDGAFVAYETLQRGRAQLVEGAEHGFTELVGGPDIVLELLSDKSEKKDTEDLRRLYWKAGVVEYWLVDARGEAPKFEIFKRGARGFVSTRKQGGWLTSAVLGRSFRLTRQTDPLGHPEYQLDVRA